MKAPLSIWDRARLQGYSRRDFVQVLLVAGRRGRHRHVGA
jgi:hypothetical protein